MSVGNGVDTRYMKRSSDDQVVADQSHSTDKVSTFHPCVSGSIDWALLPERLIQQMRISVPDTAVSDMLRERPASETTETKCTEQSSSTQHEHWTRAAEDHNDICTMFLSDPIVQRHVSSMWDTNPSVRLSVDEHNRIMREAFGAAVCGQHMPLPTCYFEIEAILDESLRGYIHTLRASKNIAD
jgi:hypothetical protein